MIEVSKSVGWLFKKAKELLCGIWQYEQCHKISQKVWNFGYVHYGNFSEQHYEMLALLKMKEIKYL